jgi:hypothetical protein
MPQALDYAMPQPPSRRRRYSVSGWVFAAMVCFLLGIVVLPSQRNWGEWASPLVFWGCGIALIVVRLLRDRGRASGQVYDV